MLAAAKPDSTSPTSCVDAEENNVIYAYGGTGCSVTEGPTIFFNCTWSLTASSPLPDLHASPMTMSSTTTSAISFGVPANTTQNIQSYSVSGTCESVSFAFTIYSLPYPERPCGRCGPNYTGHPVDMTTGEEFYRMNDLAFSGPFGLEFTRYYGNETVGQNTWAQTGKITTTRESTSLGFRRSITARL